MKQDFLQCQGHKYGTADLDDMLRGVQRFIAKELEAYEKQEKDSIVETAAAQYSFIENHLAAWVPRFCAKMREEAREDYYRGVALLTIGLPRERFFDFYGRLYFELAKPVDLVDLSQNPPIATIIRAKGVRIYERGN